MAAGRPRDDRVRAGGQRDADPARGRDGGARQRRRARAPAPDRGAPRARRALAADAQRGGRGACSGPRRRGPCSACSKTVVSEEGTARAAALPGVRVAGKTGTAQKCDEATGRYSQTRFRAWFIGVAPADEPRIVIVSELDEPKHPLHTGGAAAAPLFAQVAPGQLARHGIFLRREADRARPARAAADRRAATAPQPPPVSSAAPARATARAARPCTGGEPDASPARRAKTSGRRASRGAAAEPPTVQLSAFRDRVLLPDFSGLSKSEVRQVTAGNGLRVKLDGDGLAVRRIRRPAAGPGGERDRAHPVPRREAARRSRDRVGARRSPLMRLAALLDALPPDNAPTRRVAGSGGRQSGDPRPRLRLARGRSGRRVLRAARRRDRRARLSPLGARARRRGALRRGAARRDRARPRVRRGRARLAPRARADLRALLRRTRAASSRSSASPAPTARRARPISPSRSSRARADRSG